MLSVVCLLCAQGRAGVRPMHHLSSEEILQICKTINNSAYIIQLLQRLGGIYLTELEEENLTDIVDLTTGIVSTLEGLYEDE